MPKIRIANPRPGSARYTSPHQAERRIRRGEAVMEGDSLRFLSEAERRHLQRCGRQLIQSERQASDVYIRGMVFWNGSFPGRMYRPGEVVS